MLFNLINGLAIIIGSLAGLLVKRNVSDELSKQLLKAMSLCIIYVGVTGLSQGGRMLIVIISIVTGTIIGTLLKLEDRIHSLAERVQKKSATSSSGFSFAFANASILFCAGAMGVVGALEAGAANNGNTLLAKALIDGVVAGLLTTTAGIGVLFSSFTVVLYQGLFVLLAQALSPIITPTIATDLSVIGGIIIMAIGINMGFKSKIKIANMIPSTFIPILLGFLGLI